MRIINEYLDDFEPQEADSSVKLQPKLENHRRFVFPYDASESEEGNKAFITVNWLLPEVIDPQTALSFIILGEILVGTPASPLRKELIDSGLGEDLTGVGLEADLRQMFFSTGLKGIDLDNANKVEKLIFESLENLTKEGIDPDMVAAALNTVEFRLRENNTGQFPQGLLLMIRAFRSWLHDGDPFASLAFEAPLEAIKVQVEEGILVFEELIREHFLENPHRTTVILRPDPEEGKRREDLEKERLMRARAEMSIEELQSIIENTKELKRRQETPDSPEALATIPTLELSDLDREVKRVPIEVLERDQSKFLYHDLFTNGILYLDVGFDLRVLPQELLPYAPLYGRALLEMGTEKEDFVKLSQRIGRSTGGIRTTTYTSMIQENDQPTAWLFLRGKSTVQQAPELLDILRDVLLTVQLDNRDRFRQIVLEEKAGQEQQLLPMGHRVVNGRLRSNFNLADWASEQINGISYLFFLRQLAEDLDKDWPKVLEKLDSVHNYLLNRESIIFNVTLDETSWQAVKPELGELLKDLPAKPNYSVEWKPESLNNADGNGKYEGLTIPAQVNYVGKGANLYRQGYAYNGSVQVIINYLRATWFWEKIRVQGGAYGGFCAFDHRSGVLTFLSYRDPNLLNTLNIYDQTGQFLRQLNLSQEELTKSIIGAIGEMDAHQLPDAKGYSSMQRYLAGDSDEKRQQRRDKIFATTVDDFHAFGEVLDHMVDATQVVVLGSADSLEQLNSARDSSVKILKVL